MYRILLLTFLLCFSAKTVAQDCQSNPANLRDNRCEGYVDLTVSAGFELVAFHASRLRKYAPDDQLYVHFFQPGSGQAQVSARNIRNRSRNYRMEATQTQWDKGWQAFGPWPVADFLSPQGITMSSLGIEVQGEGGLWLPAYISNEAAAPEGSTSYRAYFSTPTTIKLLRYEVRDAQGAVLLSDETEEEEAQSIFSLKLPMPASAPAGRYMLRTQITWISGQTLLREYSFVHQP